jgi:pimeloyl-ACP methyl ester carboxylesterase
MWRRMADSWMRADRDIVLVSQRGTGGDNRLDCVLPGSDDDLQGYLEPVFRPEVLERCRAALEVKADLRCYSTPDAMDDLNELRAALGYERINLVGGSYGTRASLVYIRRHPGTVRTAILNGVAPLAFTNPLFHARAAQDALELIFAECAADPACAVAFPGLAEQFLAVLARLETAAVEVWIDHPATGERAAVRLTRHAFVESLRVYMYGESRDVPWLIRRAFEGDYEPFAQRAVERNRALHGSIAFGMLLCVTCSEDVDRIDAQTIPRLTGGTFLGDGRVRGQIAVCADWPRSPLPEGYGEPVRSDVPVLLLSGSLDPVTPPRWGEEAARHLPNALHLVVPGPHGVGGPCVEEIISDFLATGTAEGLDTACAEGMKLGAFRAE